MISEQKYSEAQAKRFDCDLRHFIAKFKYACRSRIPPKSMITHKNLIGLQISRRKKKHRRAQKPFLNMFILLQLQAINKTINAFVES